MTGGRPQRGLRAPSSRTKQGLQSRRVDRRQEVSTARASTDMPAYVAGTWTVDPVHSDVSFKVRHLLISNVRGKFHGVTGTIVLADNPLESSAVVEIDLGSIDTGNEQRDSDVRSARFFDVDTYPTMTYRSTAVRPQGEAFVVEGELSLHGVTRQVELHVDLNGFTKDPYGGTRGVHRYHQHRPPRLRHHA